MKYICNLGEFARMIEYASIMYDLILVEHSKDSWSWKQTHMYFSWNTHLFQSGYLPAWKNKKVNLVFLTHI